MFPPLKLIFKTAVQYGQLVVIDHKDRPHHFGSGNDDTVVIRLADAKLERQLTFRPQLRLGEAYMDGRLVVLNGTIFDVLARLLDGKSGRKYPMWLSTIDRLGMLTRRFQQYNPIARSRRNVAHHYDIDGKLYDLFLDSDRQYSCAYFNNTDNLEEAQLAKKRHIAAKLLVGKNMRALDIGSGWGGLALYLSEIADMDVTGITLSKEQLDVSRQRAEASGQKERARFEYRDFREMTGAYDRIVSVGMLEHVGISHYKAYFKKIYDLMADDGVAVVHCIGRSDQPAPTNAFISKYIFPGGYIPSLSEVMPAVEASGLVTSDVEILRLHYAETLRHWRERLVANKVKVCARNGQRFYRMWEFYLAGSEAAFRFQDFMVFQLQLAKKISTVPLTRDYIDREEQRLRVRERDLWRHDRRTA